MCAMRTYMYMSHLLCLYTCVNCSILVIVFSPLFLPQLVLLQLLIHYFPSGTSQQIHVRQSVPIFKVSSRSSFVNKMAGETRIPDRFNTKNDGPTRDASQLIKVHDFTGSKILIIEYYNRQLKIKGSQWHMFGILYLYYYIFIL